MRSPRSVKAATGTIAFVWGDRIFLMEPDGTDKRPMPGIPTHAAEPAWRPDSRRLAYVSGGWLYTVDPDGANIRRLSEERQDVRDLSWAPDGRLLAARIWTGNGSLIHVLDTVTGASWPLTGANTSASHPAWSPSGGRIAYQAIGKGPEDFSQLYVMDALTGINVGPPVGLYITPAWSPDGRWLAVGHYDDGPVIAVVPATLDGARRIVGGGGTAGRLSWSPDSSRIAFKRWSYGSHDIWSVDVATGAELRLTTSPFQEAQPSWAP